MHGIAACRSLPGNPDTPSMAVSACEKNVIPRTCLDQIENGVAVGFPMEELVGDGVTENDLSLTLAPSAEERAKLDPFYMS